MDLGARHPKNASPDRPDWSRHASRRWRERFADLSRADEWASAMTAAGRVGRGRRRQLRRQCRGHAQMGMLSGNFRGVYYRVSRSGVVFVVAPGYRIVTVFPLEGPRFPLGG